ncbi:unnamed protein product [Cylindrotheca closterium]|uniref:Uncharacterized protein n=1 Tax=Cylindrotheca closterium TaxID=2856 RepID=A0AAD2FCL8_9STRA|nr:unnamed protein product [Cylindrotheca closterium]
MENSEKEDEKDNKNQLSTSMSRTMSTADDERQWHRRTFVYDLKSSINHKESETPNDVTEVTVDSSVHAIGDSAFFYWSMLVHVEFSERTTRLHTISSSAFQYCTSLQFVSIPSSVITIGPLAFSGCTSLVKVEWLTPYCSYFKKEEEDEKEVSAASIISDHHSSTTTNMLKIIGGYAFAGCVSLLNLVVPNQVTKLSQGVFQGCTSLAFVDLRHAAGLKSIGSCCMENCSSLQSISIPSTVTTIGNSAFAGCHSLQELELYEGLRTIGRKSFADCQSLATVCFPLSLNDIGREAFFGCTGLLGVRIPANSKVSLEKYCFGECSSLVTVCIPTSVAYLPYDCFSHCQAMMMKHTSSTVIKEPDVEELMSLHSLLRNRYDGLPAHQVCYYYGSTASTTVENMELTRIIIQEDEEEEERVNHWKEEDVFGMTPLHILATCGYSSLMVGTRTATTDLFATLLQQYPLDVIWHKDTTLGRNSIMDYLMLPYRSSRVIPLIQMVLRRVIVDEMKQYHRWGLECWMDEMLCLIDSIGITHDDHDDDDDNDTTSHDFARTQDYLKLVNEELAGYLKLEATSILELAVWKLKIQDIDSNAAAETVTKDDDESNNDGYHHYRDPLLRSISGMGILIPNVIVFLLNETTPASDFTSCILPFDADDHWHD